MELVQGLFIDKIREVESEVKKLEPVDEVAKRRLQVLCACELRNKSIS